MTEKLRDETNGADGDAKPAHEPEGPPEIIAAAKQELEYPADETDEG